MKRERACTLSTAISSSPSPAMPSGSCLAQNMIKVKPLPPHLLSLYGTPWLPQPLPPSCRKRGSWVKALHRRLELTKKRRRRRRGKRGGRKKPCDRWVDVPLAKKTKKKKWKRRRKRPVAKSECWWGRECDGGCSCD